MAGRIEYEADFPTMNVAQLEPYLCFKAKLNYKACKDCLGQHGCPPGKRLAELMDDVKIAEQKPEQKTELEQDSEELKKPSNRGAVAREKNAQRAREICELVLSEDDPIQALMDLSGKSYDTANERLKKYSQRYADVFLHYGKTLEGVRKHHQDLKKGVVQESKPEEPEEDEISIEAFLREYTGEPEKPAETPLVERVIKPLPGGTETEIALFGALEIKDQELAAEEESCRQEIERLKGRIAWLETQREALARTRNLFDQSTETARSLITG